MRSIFNSLLMSLAVLDIIVVIISIWDNSLIKIFHVYSELYLNSFPYIWYPIKEMSKLFLQKYFPLSSKIIWLYSPISNQFYVDWIWTELPQNIAMSATTFLTMALATERFLAVRLPIMYRSLGKYILEMKHYSTLDKSFFWEKNRTGWQACIHFGIRNNPQLQCQTDLLPPPCPPWLPPTQHSQVPGGSAGHDDLRGWQCDSGIFIHQRDQPEGIPHFTLNY